jgi:hypothetical protein
MTKECSLGSPWISFVGLLIEVIKARSEWVVGE